MTFLPILERELRVRSRGKANHWSRFAVAAVGCLTCLPPLLWSGPSFNPATLGRNVFEGLIWASFLLCCSACLLTADTISGEKREGTLGLLFLTRVRDFDVLVGKFASNGMVCLLGLVALLPVLMIPLLAGGVTGWEALRKGLGLLDVLFLALSAGLWASVHGQERFETTRTAFLVVFGIVVVPALLGFLLRGTRLELVSPLYVLFQASDMAYRASPAKYWTSFALLQLVSWGLLLNVRSSLRERLRAGDEVRPFRRPKPKQPFAHPFSRSSPKPAEEPGTETAQAPSVLVERIPIPGTSLTTPTPLHWLVRRQRGLRLLVWVPALLTFFQYLLFGVTGRWLGGWMIYGLSWPASFVISSLTGTMFAWAASRFFVEARRTGELELLLTTPLGSTNLVAAQWDYLRKLLRWPVVFMLVPLVLQSLYFLFGIPLLWLDPWHYLYRLTLNMLLGALNLIVGVLAVCWLGLWFGWRSGGQARAIISSVVWARGLPYLLNLIWMFASQSLLSSARSSYNGVSLLLFVAAPQLGTLLLSFWLIHIARTQLDREISGAPPLPMRRLFSAGFRRIPAAIRRTRHWSPADAGS